MAKVRHAVFTLFNYDEEKIDYLKSLDYDYLVFGYELCPTTQREHLQGYVCFSSQIGTARIGKRLGCKFIKMLGTPQQASDYCKKGGNFEEFGTLPATQSKNGGDATKKKWLAIKDLAKNGDWETLENEHPREFVLHYQKLQQIHKDFRPKAPDNNKPCGLWIWGPTGSGKSTMARSFGVYYEKMCNKWWDGYRGEERVIIDDFDKSHSVLGHHLKIWADKWSFTAEIKGGAISIRPKKLIVTSNYHPEEIWEDPGMLDPILRRFKIIKKD